MGEKLYFQPLAESSKSGVRYKLWIGRAIAILEVFGIKSGPMFQATRTKSKAVKQAGVVDLDVLFRDLMKQVQARRPDLLPETVDVDTEVSIRRSLRRAFTAQAQNVGVPQEAIKANNHWRKFMRARGGLPAMSMIERYSDAKATVDYLVRPSGCL